MSGIADLIPNLDGGRRLTLILVFRLVIIQMHIHDFPQSF